jgi:Flp pilus assembly protein TadG
MKCIRKKIGEKGAAVVEFAVVLPLLLLILFGIIEFGVLLYDKAVITNASREGARAAIVYGYDPNLEQIQRLSDAEISAVVTSYVSAKLISFGTGTPVTTITPPDPTQVPSGNPITVTVTYHYDFLIVPAFISNFLGGINLVGATTMRAE